MAQAGYYDDNGTYVPPDQETGYPSAPTYPDPSPGGAGTSYYTTEEYQRAIDAFNARNQKVGGGFGENTLKKALGDYIDARRAGKSHDDALNAGYTYYFGGDDSPRINAGITGGGSGDGENGDFEIDPAMLAPWTERFQGVPSPPTFTPPGFTTPPPFSYAPFDYERFDAGDPFTAPTMEQAQQEPGYQFALDQGLKALQQSAAAKGVLRTGGTLKDLISFGQAAGQGNYQNVFNRNLGTHQTNFGNKLNAFQTNFGNKLNAYQTNFQDTLASYGTNYGISKDAYDYLYRGAQDQFNSLANQNATDYSRARTDYDSRYNIFRNNANDPFQKQLSLAQLGAGVAA